jgi:hypothetical protein
MRNSLAVVLLFAAFSAVPALRAQEEPSEAGTVWRLQLHPLQYKRQGQRPTTLATFNANGGDGQLVYNVNKWLGVLGDVGG